MKVLVFQQATVHLCIVKAQHDNVERVKYVKLSDITDVSIDSTVVFCEHVESLLCACTSRDQRLHFVSQLSKHGLSA